jgi:hypothetical protein
LHDIVGRPHDFGNLHHQVTFGELNSEGQKIRSKFACLGICPKRESWFTPVALLFRRAVLPKLSFLVFLSWAFIVLSKLGKFIAGFAPSS